MYYIFVQNNNITGKGQCKCLNDNVINLIVDKETFDNIEKYIYSDGSVILNPEYDTIKLNNKKLEKIKYNDILRDNALNQGVTYKDILFDSDTDQKANLLATYQMMSDEDTITWYGKNNKALLCTKQDLVAIGKLIVQLHSYCWNMNAYVKEQIENAGTVEELDSIIVDYRKGIDEQ